MENKLATLISVIDTSTAWRDKIIKLLSLSEDPYTGLGLATIDELIAYLNDKKEHPCFCIITIDAHHKEEFDKIQGIKDKWPSIYLIIVSATFTKDRILSLLKMGIDGYIAKSLVTQELLPSVQSVIDNGYYYSGKTVEHIFNTQYSGENYPKISKKQKHFLSLCCSDLNYHEIGAIMGLSSRTVESYRDILFKKLNISSRVGLAMFALRRGIAPIT